MTEELDWVIAAYADARSRPGGTRLAEWVARHPRHAETLAEFALYETVLEGRTPDGRLAAAGAEYAEPDAEECAAFLARAALIRAAMQAASARPLHSLVKAAGEAGVGPAALASRLLLGMAEVARLDRRLFTTATLPLRLIEDLAAAVRRPVSDVLAYLRLPPTLAPGASYRSDAAPRVGAQVPFGPTVEAATDMSDEQKAFWRAEGGRLLDEEGSGP